MGIQQELSIFVDESGSQNGHSKYCIVSLVFHEQVVSLDEVISAYEQDLRNKSLPDIPFHASPLMNGKDKYKNLDLQVRKRLFSCFEAFCRKAPFACKTFSYLRCEVQSSHAFINRFRQDLAAFLKKNLQYFQNFDHVKIYYDNGQPMVSDALHGAIDEILFKDAVVYKAASPKEYRLSQVADCVCTLELTNLKYLDKELTETDKKIFGTNYGAFKRNHFKDIRKKELDSSRK